MFASIASSKYVTAGEENEVRVTQIGKEKE